MADGGMSGRAREPEGDKPLDVGALRDLARDLRDASDSAILRVTKVIDRLPDRGAADRLLEGLRPRLSALRPPRPMTFSRALFIPLDPVIVPAAEWRSQTGAVPRSIIAPVAALIQPAHSDASDVLACLAAGRRPEPEFWREAADILGTRPIPADWSLPDFQSCTGIRPQALPGLLAAIRLVFSNAALFGPSRHAVSPSPEQIRPVLLEAARAGAASWSVVLALLFEISTAPAALVDIVLGIAGETRLAAQLGDSLQQVVAGVVEKLDRPSPKAGEAAPLTDAALDAQSRCAARIAGFSALRGDMVGFARSLTQRRQEIADACSVQLACGLKSAADSCTPETPETPDMEQAAAERLESRLLALRRLELAARPLADAQTRERLLAQAAAAYCGNEGPDWLTQADRLRFCEILVGAEAALRLVGPH